MSELVDGVWHTPDGRPYERQEYARDADYRRRVEDLVAARDGGSRPAEAPAAAETSGRVAAVVVPDRTRPADTR